MKISAQIKDIQAWDYTRDPDNYEIRMVVNAEAAKALMGRWNVTFEFEPEK